MSEFKKYVLVENIDNYEVVKSQIEVKEPPQNPNYRQVNKFLAEKEKKKIVFENGSCKYVEDKRNSKYWLPTDKHDSEAREITELGETLPPNAIYEAPPKTEEEQAIEDEQTAQAELNASVPNLSEIVEAVDALVNGNPVPNEIKAKFTEFKAKAEPIKQRKQAAFARIQAAKESQSRSKFNRNDD